MSEIEKLLDGYRQFHRDYFISGRAAANGLAAGQAPKVAMIACSDSRVDPSIITDADLGEIFVIRNVANLVPPCQPDDGYHGTSAALEFAVRALGVTDIVVLGHSGCAGIRALLNGPGGAGDYSFVNHWVEIAAEARETVQRDHAHRSIEEQAHCCERAGIALSLKNLKSFPFVAQPLEAGALRLHGWHFDLAEGTLWGRDETRDAWEKLT